MRPFEVKKYQGIWFPEKEIHFVEMVDKVPLVNGKGVYQYHKYRDCLKRFKQRRRVIDIGAHIGFWSMHMRKDFQQVESFEPVPLHRYCFLANVFEEEPGAHGTSFLEAIIHDENCNLYPYALAEKEKTVSICTPNPEETGDTWVRDEGLDLDRVNKYKDWDSVTDENVAENVPAYPLDSFNFENVDMIKIDCEGYEFFILQGAKETLLKWKPLVIVEQKPTLALKYHLEETQAVTYLKSLGAKFRRNMSNDFIMSWD